MVPGLAKLHEALKALSNLNEAEFLSMARPHPMDDNTIFGIVELIKLWQGVLQEFRKELAAVLEIERGRR